MKHIWSIAQGCSLVVVDHSRVGSVFLSLPSVVAMYEFFWEVVEVGISGEPLDTLSVGGWERVVGLGKLFYT